MNNRRVRNFSWNAERLIKFRTKFKLTQMNLAQLIGANRQQTISEWELGKYRIGNAYCNVLDRLEKTIEMMYVANNHNLFELHYFLNLEYRLEPLASEINFAKSGLGSKEADINITNGDVDAVSEKEKERPIEPQADVCGILDRGEPDGV